MDIVEFGRLMVAVFPAVCFTSETGKETVVPFLKTAVAMTVWTLNPCAAVRVTDAGAVRLREGRLTFAFTDSEIEGLKTVYDGVIFVVMLTTACVLG